MQLMEMVEMLAWTPDMIQERREEILQQDPPQIRQQDLNTVLRSLTSSLQTALDEGLNVDGVFHAGQSAVLIQLHIDDPEQMRLADQVRQACLETLYAQDYLIFHNKALPAMKQLVQTITP